MSRTLNVWWDDACVGALALNAYGEPEFTYAAEWLARPDARAISVSLPLQAETFDRRTALPFFEGLLPEAAQRTGVARALGISESNAFALLEGIGGEAAGALRLLPAGAEGTDRAARSERQILDDIALAALMRSLPTRPMLAGNEDGRRLSLAGAQPKLPVIVEDGRIALPAPGEATTHILKPEIGGFPGTAENEAFCLALAAGIGLDAVSAEYRILHEIPFLLIARYDRVADASGWVRRLHQEDVCQALGFTSQQKYASEGGPVLRDCFGLLRQVSTRPAIDVLKLLDAVIFNALIGNADAHGKNVSLLHTDGGIRLAPFYDLLSTVAYPELSPRFAMKIGGCRTLEELNAADWSKFSAENSIGGPFVLRRVRELSDMVLGQADSICSALAFPRARKDFADKIVSTVKDRVSLARAKVARRG